MATINYKEKYEKAVQAAMLAKQDTESAVTIRILEEIFPELKESEDERIRKELIMMVKLSCTDGDDVDKKIAWLERQVEQKPAWSEEDEEMLKMVIKLCEQCGNEYAYYWLKSLKDRVQPKQEWSDVDKDILFRTIDSLKFIKDTISTDPEYAVNIIDIEREITWLKSLRPQSQWKPSDEQMEYLAKAITTRK